MTNPLVIALALALVTLVGVVALRSMGAQRVARNWVLLLVAVALMLIAVSWFTK